MIAVILRFEIIWYICLSLSEELSLFFFFYFQVKSKVLSHKWISVQNSPRSAGSSPPPGTAHQWPIARQGGSKSNIWGYELMQNRGLRMCLLPVRILITFSYLISYRSWTQTLWCFAQAHGCRNAFCLHSVSCLLPEWGKSSQLSEDTGIFFVLFSLSYQN